MTQQLRRRVADSNSTALITTHSPFVARGLPLGSNVVWVKEGGVTESKESELIKSLLGWGALDKPILLCTEDSDAQPLGELIRQVPDLDNLVSVFPFNGVKGLGRGSVLSELKKKLGGQHKVMVHRDRDGMTDDELIKWKKEYTDHGIIPWVTDGSDIESYFCDAAYLACLYSKPLEDAVKLIGDLVDQKSEDYQRTFSNKRKEINIIYEKTGGSPVTGELQSGWPLYRWIKGKDLISHLRDEVRTKWFVDDKLIGRATPHYTVAIDLLKFLHTLA